VSCIGVKKNVWLYTAAIRACAKGQQLETALGLLREVTSSPTLAPSDDYEKLCLYTAALDACEKSGNGAEALHLLREMKAEAGVEPDEVAYGAAISACRKAGLAADSLRLLSFMVNLRMTPNLSVYNTVLGALCSTPQYLTKAVEILKFMIQSGGKGNVPKPNAQSFSQVVDALADDLQWKEAIEMYESMRKEGHRPEVLTCAKVVRACEKNQCWREALQLLDNMRKDDYQIYELQLLDQVFKKVLQVVAAGFGKAHSSAAEGSGQGEGERRLDKALRTEDKETTSPVEAADARPTERIE
jgi:pentatricopeptide repeat protein